ncbi:MAG TPA: ester cyclase [Polyangiaceae bacterium]|nr:ester cyclase [Polyangiaceae bacterium]
MSTMRKLILGLGVASIAAGFFGCADESEGPSTAGAESALAQTEANKALALRALDEIFNGHDLAKVDEYYAENFTQHNVEAGEGRESVKQYFGVLFRGFPDWKAEVEHVVAEGDKVTLFVTWSGTHTGEFFGVAPTGKRVVTRTSDLIRVENGKLAEHWDVVADLPMREALGFVEVKQPQE